MQGRGLACPVGAYEAEELALRYPEVEFVHGCKFSELFCKGVRLYGVQSITCLGLKLVLVVYLVFYGICGCGWCVGSIFLMREGNIFMRVSYIWYGVESYEY